MMHLLQSSNRVALSFCNRQALHRNDQITSTGCSEWRYIEIA